MKRKIVFTKAFQRSYKKFSSRSPLLEKGIRNALSKLLEDPYAPELRTHKLSGKLAAYLACYCGYDCRIVFTIEHISDTEGYQDIVLLDIGTHDEVY